VVPCPIRIQRQCTDSDGSFTGSADGGEDVGGGFGTDDESGAPALLGGGAFDGGLHIDDASGGAALHPTTVSAEKKPSTALSLEAEVRWSVAVPRGWRASQARTFGCL